MASPSDHPKKDGIRCEGIFPAQHKFSGKTCNALVFERDPEQGLGARCGRCGTFHTFEELSQKVESVQSDSAAHDQTQPQTQREQGDGKMETQADRQKAKNLVSHGWKTNFFKGCMELWNSYCIDPEGHSGYAEAKDLNFDPDLIEQNTGALFEIEDGGRRWILTWSTEVSGRPDLKVEFKFFDAVNKEIISDMWIRYRSPALEFWAGGPLKSVTMKSVDGFSNVHKVEFRFQDKGTAQTCYCEVDKMNNRFSVGVLCANGLFSAPLFRIKKFTPFTMPVT